MFRTYACKGLPMPSRLLPVCSPGGPGPAAGGRQHWGESLEQSRHVHSHGHLGVNLTPEVPWGAGCASQVWRLRPDLKLNTIFVGLPSPIRLIFVPNSPRVSAELHGLPVLGLIGGIPVRRERVVLMDRRSVFVAACSWLRCWSSTRMGGYTPTLISPVAAR